MPISNLSVALIFLSNLYSLLYIVTIFMDKIVLVHNRPYNTSSISELSRARYNLISLTWLLYTTLTSIWKENES